MRQDDVRNIAVMVAGTDEEYQSSVLNGIRQAAKELQVNISVFASFGGVLSSDLYDMGEYNIYSLANFTGFDGVILLTNTIGDIMVRQHIYDAVKAAGIPAVALDNEDNPEFYDIRIDNYGAMRQIVEHVLGVHGAKTVNYISGPLENPEARTRFNAFRSVMQAHQLTVDENRVYYGTFRPIDGKEAADQILSCGLPLPDAVIAANDAMALEAITVFAENGIRVPEDIIVTGFDGTYYAQHHCPSLTTVARPLFEAGKTAVELLVRICSGETCEKTVSLDAHTICQESCGCTSSESIDIQSYKKGTYSLIKRARSDVSLLNRISSALAASETPEENIRIISKFLHELQSWQFCICLCENWESAYLDGHAGESTAQYHITGYTEFMSAPLIWTEGTISEMGCFPSKEMYPLPIEKPGTFSYFFPLHFRERCLGYYIFSETEFPVQSMLCHSLMMNISNSFENVRKLLHMNNALRELDRLYVIDPLCNIYNRNGFIRVADQIFKHCRETDDTLLISFIDMDGLKMINDNYGHDEGDFALRRLASVINNSCLRGQICARFGGDEFIVIGSGASESDALNFEQGFRKRMSETNMILGKPYELSASIGTFVTRVKPSMKLFNLISQADQIMYEQKKRKRTSRYLRRD